MQLIQQWIIQVVSIENCLAQQTGGRISSSNVKQLTNAQVDSMLLGIAESK
ncbi:hypothetical protein [Herbaspirillum sp. 1130]|uniref:hypothetical protein n=1 Tax=Herbaspirillum sp. 1130 TaxID=2806562 RepID=UPI001AE21FB8|nr:hypothetical protein [Herbaspirillum sp. 1130]MBP1318320.1 hypothetical protein [Herbaspirillum sp. 1130]